MEQKTEAPPSRSLAEQHQELLKRFKFDKILHEDTERKSISLLGIIAPAEQSEGNASPVEEAHGPAIVILSRTRLGDSQDLKNLKAGGLKVIDEGAPRTPTVIVSRWKKFKAKSNTSEGVLFVSLLCPASEHDINKAKSKNLELIKEVAEMYKDVIQHILPNRNPTKFFDDVQENKVISIVAR